MSLSLGGVTDGDEKILETPEANSETDNGTTLTVKKLRQTETLEANSETDNGTTLTVKNLRQTETPEATVMISSVLMPVTW